MSNKHVLVTGGAGFIGSAMVIRLVREGYRVRVLDDFSRGASARLATVAEQVEIVSGDVRDAGLVRKACQGVEGVFHFAYINGTRYFYEKPELVLDVGIRGMLAVVDAVRDNAIKEFYLASSSEVYQTPDAIPTDENQCLRVPDPRNPRYSYGGGKITCELLALHAIKPLVEKMVIFRPHNVYGPDMGNEHVIPELIRKLKAAATEQPDGQPIPLPLKGDGRATRAFIYIDDFVEALMKIVDASSVEDIYHIGTREEVSIAELAHSISALMGIESELVFSAVPAGETPRRVPDTTRLEQLGFNPSVNLEAGLRRVLAAENQAARD